MFDKMFKLTGILWNFEVFYLYIHVVEVHVQINFFGQKIPSVEKNYCCCFLDLYLYDSLLCKLFSWMQEGHFIIQLICHHISNIFENYAVPGMVWKVLKVLSE